jgi:hypothetical protein
MANTAPMGILKHKYEHSCPATPLMQTLVDIFKIGAGIAACFPYGGLAQGIVTIALTILQRIQVSRDEKRLVLITMDC